MTCSACKNIIHATLDIGCMLETVDESQLGDFHSGFYIDGTPDFAVGLMDRFKPAAMYIFLIRTTSHIIMPCLEAVDAICTFEIDHTHPLSMFPGIENAFLDSFDHSALVSEQAVEQRQDLLSRLSGLNAAAEMRLRRTVLRMENMLK
jgi:hypothetical protein